MDRIYESGAAPSAPAVPAGASPGYPSSGNPSLGVSPTKPGPYWFHMIAEEIMNVIVAAGVEPDAANLGQLAAALPKIRSIAALPSTDIGPIIVAEVGEVWIWQDGPYYTGYKSLLCGRPVWGHTLSPLDTEVDAVGGLVPKADYAALWGYAQENGLVVPQATWEAEIGAHFFVDADATHFRLPDLRNQFARWAAGANDIDTANVRGLGSWQQDDFRAHRHGTRVNAGNAAAGTGRTPVDGAGDYSYTIAETVGGAETRPSNTAYYPRIHV